MSAKAFALDAKAFALDAKALDAKALDAKALDAKAIDTKALDAKALDAKALALDTKPLKIVVFDLDETLGCFTEIGLFWSALEYHYGHNLFKERFFEVLDTFQEFLRPNIFKILAFVKEQKVRKLCDHVMIYTNNQGPKSWVKMISEYFNDKLDYILFDKIIAAFKVHNKIIEMCRTSHDKSVDDLIRCTKIPSNAEICFIDDQFHPLMEKDNVYYVHVKSYIFTMPFAEMASRYFDKYIKTELNCKKPNCTDCKPNCKKPNCTDCKPNCKKDVFVNDIVTYMKKYNFIVREKTVVEQNADKVVSKQLLIHLEHFFKHGRTKNTRKHKSRIKSKMKTMKRTFAKSAAKGPPIAPYRTFSKHFF